MTRVEKTCSCCQRVYACEEDFFQNTSRWRKCARGNLYFNCSCQSSLMLPVGKYPWFAPDRAMGPVAAGLFHTLKAGALLPPVSAVAEELLMGLQGGKELETSHIVHLLRRDPVLSAQVVRAACARSPLSGSPPVTSLLHAVSSIGRKELAAVVQVASIGSTQLKTRHFSVELFWEASFLTGAIAEKLATLFARHVDPCGAFLAGSLCNLGKLVGAILCPEETDAICAYQQNPTTVCNWRVAESHLKVRSHLVLGEVGAVFWGLPESVLTCIEKHHSLPQSPAQNNPRVTLEEIIAFASQLQLWVRGEAYQVEQELLTALRTVFELSQQNLEALVEELRPLKHAAETPSFVNFART